MSLLLLFNRPAAYVVAANLATFVESGADAGLFAGHRLGLGTGAFAENGIAAGTRFTRTITAPPGSFVEIASDARVFVGHRLWVGTGTFTENGIAAGLRFTRTITATPGSFAGSGIAAWLLSTRTVTAGLGDFTENGSAVTFILWKPPNPVTITVATVLAYEVGIMDEEKTTTLVVSDTTAGSVAELDALAYVVEVSDGIR